MRDSHAKHLSDSLTFVQAHVDYQLNDTSATTAKSSSVDEIDSSSEAFPNAQVMLDDDGEISTSSRTLAQHEGRKNNSIQNEATQQKAHERRTEGTTYVLSRRYSRAQKLVRWHRAIRHYAEQI